VVGHDYGVVRNGSAVMCVASLPMLSPYRRARGVARESLDYAAIPFRDDEVVGLGP
jgi:hypothetical protein